MKNKIITIFAIITLIIGMLFSIKLPKGNYIGDYAMKAFGLNFSKIICVIFVLTALYIGQKYSKNLLKLNFIMRITFTFLFIISLITNTFF